MYFLSLFAIVVFETAFAFCAIKMISMDSAQRAFKIANIRRFKKPRKTSWKCANLFWTDIYWNSTTLNTSLLKFTYIGFYWRLCKPWGSVAFRIQSLSNSELRSATKSWRSLMKACYSHRILNQMELDSFCYYDRLWFQPSKTVQRSGCEKF